MHPNPPHSPASDGCPPIWCLLGAGSLNALECSMTSALAAQRPHTHTEAKWLIVLAREERTRRRRRRWRRWMQCGYYSLAKVYIKSVDRTDPLIRTLVTLVIVCRRLRSWRRRWETQGEAHWPGISRTWVSMSTEWLMILLSRQLWERLHIVRTAISHALLALDCRLIEPHPRRIVTGAGGDEWRCPFSGLEAYCRKWRWAKMVSDDNGHFMWIRLSFFKACSK